ncbi:MAG: efflux RND transporter periplasmic adaptor subunit, partial [Ignavibacteriae bacterium]|nr:efflux RND transporter periplasmic adaptor subunit [Ignavibacteriota bacterium]
TVTATGTTIIRKEVQLRSPISGVIVHFLFFNGDTIRSGQPAAEVRSRESQASLQGAEELRRVAQTQTQREEAEKALDLAQKTSNTVTIRAPFTGIVSGKAKNEMEVVSEGDPIATLIDPSSIFFVSDISSASLSHVRLGNEARIRFTTKQGKMYRGKVYRIEPQMNPGDQTVRVHIMFTGGIPDMEGSLFGEASIVVGKRQNVLLVPLSAILRNDETNTTSVMLVGAEDSVAFSARVSVGVRQDSVVEVASSSLKPGDMVIIEGQYGLPDSTKVRVLQ